MAFKSKNKKSAVVSVTSTRVSKPTPPKPAFSADECRKTARTIIAALAEKEERPQKKIYWLAHRLGPEKALGYLKQAQEIDAHGGMLTNDGKHNRTLGGMFFKIVKTAHPELFVFTKRGPTAQ